MSNSKEVTFHSGTFMLGHYVIMYVSFNYLFHRLASSYVPTLRAINQTANQQNYPLSSPLIYCKRLRSLILLTSSYQSPYTSIALVITIIYKHIITSMGGCLCIVLVFHIKSGVCKKFVKSSSDGMLILLWPRRFSLGFVV